MNAPFKRPADRAANIRNLADRAQAWADQPNNLHRERAFYKAVINAVDDGDCLTALEILDFEYPEPTRREFNPSLVHPDDGCQSKGFGA